MAVGIYIRCHGDLLCESYPITIDSPSGLTIHKENLSSLCGPSFPFTEHRNPEDVALELARGKDMCYSRKEYESILEKAHPRSIQRNSEGKLLYIGKEFDDDVFENVCEKILGKQRWIKKIYTVSYNPENFSMFTIAFQGKSCNILATSIDDFCSTFDFKLEETEKLSTLLDELYKTDTFTTEFIFELASLFQTLGATDIHILDESCSIPNARCHIAKDTLQDFVEEHKLGFGGTRKKKKKKKTKRKNK